ncbi:hypothetical protein LLE49_03190 [Alicyclobacillus tolerans]|uniref:vWA domain-containing protein n=1 Tax=Alicyclobacillus tolerans TaxID=90970 RepID=UPI001F2722E2|nr:hypothetical protein [Alicyclobacillus tolerans]MCF8563743.1 hypothetical protein [Alicyclobacillus tolerans]
MSFVEDAMPLQLHMELLDLAQTLARSRTLALAAAAHDRFDWARQRVAVNRFWLSRVGLEQKLGLKSDVYLRALGSAMYTDAKSLRTYLQSAQTSGLPNFSRQLLAICEDARLERLCLEIRPGTENAFMTRTRVLGGFYREQLQHLLGQGREADVVLLQIYEILHSVAPTAQMSSLVQRSSQVSRAGLWKGLAPWVNQAVDAKSTAEAARICSAIVMSVRQFLQQDAATEFFFTDEYNAREQSETHAEEQGQRQSPLENADAQQEELTGSHHQSLSTWHRETQSHLSDAMKMDLERGTKTKSENVSGQWQMANEEPGPIHVVQGNASNSEESWPDDNDAKPSERIATPNSGSEATDPSNRMDVRHVFLDATAPSHEEVLEYRQMLERVDWISRRLQRTIESNVENKKLATPSDRFRGRLSRKLVHVVIDQNPRLFYKRDSPSASIDAAFLLLVDCSGSMHDRLAETKLGVVLFHETLRRLRVPHAIVGFWEDSEELHDQRGVTLFQRIIPFEHSLSKESGARIVQMASHLDNRDGYAIRVAASMLGRRAEQRKFLIVFSDGEPAALDYEGNGAADTHAAVIQVRRQGYDVLNLFFASSADDVHKTSIETIYGDKGIVLQNVEQLPDRLAGALKKLLHTAL